MNEENHGKCSEGHAYALGGETSGVCETHELHLSQMDALYGVSQVLSRSLDYRETIQEVLRILDESAGLSRGLVSVVEPDGSLLVQSVHGVDPGHFESVRYQSGEGIIGFAMEKSRTIILQRVGDDLRFINKMRVYDPGLPFIAVPIKVAGSLKGVLAVQPVVEDDPLLEDRARFLEMIANLIGQSLRLSLQVEQEKRSLLEERDLLRRTVRHQHGFDSIVGHSAVMRRVFEQVRLVAKWNTTVLIRGETGTGKELIANAIHYNSPRTRGPLVKLNCAALPENLLESELFGHERGSFTGAVGSRKGRFEQADGGTLFLDEIGEISPAFQAKLLRVLQEGEFERVGGSRSIKVDVRIIAATHRDLETAVDMGDFREDLFYRLNVMPLYLPPLRDRLEDISDICRHLLTKVGNVQKRKLTITDSALRRLANYDWPGNVRELENCLERAAVLSEDGTIDGDLIRFPGRERMPQRAGVPLAAPVRAAAVPAPTGEPAAPDDPNLSERERVIAALEQAGWVQAKAARILNMTPRQIAYRIQTLNIEVKQF
ncbi:MAG: nif-specific transcriptional activator NifA [Azovibrio sp.]|uniref:nif-specific transcriptional activator NifA n=1 Tax=Azovibrio sp. TaxID=1872673 RepID=UPI003C721A5A